MHVDYWAHRYIDNPKLREEAFNPDYEADLAEMEAEVNAGQAAAATPADEWETVSDVTYGGPA